MKEGDIDRDNDKGSPWASPNRASRQSKAEDMKLWGVFLFGLIGATATTFAVIQLRRTVDWFCIQLIRSQKGGTSSSFRSAFQEEAWKRYNRRLQEEYEVEMERVERIRRMQAVFNREKNKYKKSYERWREYGPEAYHEHFQRDDWYWKTDTSYRDSGTNYRGSPRAGVGGSCSLSHHYSVLGLDRYRRTPYTDAEIKTAFRVKAMEFHPDQNQGNKEVAEAKFKEVMASYETINKDRNNRSL